MLRGIARDFSKAKHALLRDVLKTKPLGKEAVNALKRDFSLKYGLTSRQYNAMLCAVEGLIDSQRELQKLNLEDVETKIKTLQAALSTKKRKKNKIAPADPKKAAFSKHQKKRRLASFEKKRDVLKADIAIGRVRTAFGTKKLFHAQHNLAKNGYVTHADWKEDWINARENQFFVLGSGDETGGCQGCSAFLAEDGTVSLKVRLLKNSSQKYIEFHGLSFNVGQDALVVAIQKNEEAAESRRKKAPSLGIALTWRFLRDEKGWKIFVSFDLPDVKSVSIKDSGRIGVDLNADHLAVSEVDRYGNPVGRWTFPLVTYGKTKDQVAAIVGDTVKQIIALAAEKKKPIVVEKLDFKKKKAALAGDKPKYARMLSSLTYSKILGAFQARCFDVGIELLEVNPSFTSVIGEHLFQRQHGMSRHQAASVVIARRSLHFCERPPSPLPGHLSSTCTDRSKHVWRRWTEIAKRKATHAASVISINSASTSPTLARGKARRAQLSPNRSKQIARVGESPTGESYPTLFGVCK
jgi:IS605 OrfB family transposase